jgi:hypothetical protein
MAEPASATLTTAAVTATAATTALIPGIDGDALVGAIAGGMLYVTSTRDLPPLSRAVYLLVSTAAGYFAAPELLQVLPLKSVGLAAFFGGAVVVTVAIQAIERVKTLDFSTLFTKRGA